MKFKIHAEGVALEAKVRVKLWHLLEVQAQCAVVLTGNRDVLAAEERRVALVGLQGQRLGEREVSVAAEKLVDDGVRVAAQHARILLTGFHHVVAAKDGLQVATKVCVLIHII